MQDARGPQEEFDVTLLSPAAPTLADQLLLPKLGPFLVEHPSGNLRLDGPLRGKTSNMKVKSSR